MDIAVSSTCSNCSNIIPPEVISKPLGVINGLVGVSVFRILIYSLRLFINFNYKNIKLGRKKTQY